jgi:purine-nucleoside phosphorylase
VLEQFDQLTEAAELLVGRVSEPPLVGLILGSGLGAVGESIELDAAIDYGDIPHFLRPTAIGHQGRLLLGRLAGTPVVAMQGRYHLYEGHAAGRVTFPVRVMNALGIKALVVSNAAGGLNPNFAVGDIMVIDDHINLMNRNPLVGVNDDRLGPRFPDMSSPYDRQLGDQALAIARREDFPCHRGTYIGMLGPNYETRAEIRMLRGWGDAVGMSTVPEVIVAAQAGLRVLGLSTITNVCSPDLSHEASGEAVVAVANAASQRLQLIVQGVISQLIT